MAGDPGRDDVEGLVVVDLPTQRRGVLGRTALQQKSALIAVESEAR